jgi:hypothetical protein
VRRLLRQLKRRGDKAVVHALRGESSNRKIEEVTRLKAIEMLSQAVYRGFGPTLASEYLAKKHDIEVSRETTRKWMMEAKLWRPRRQRVEKIHEWRPRRSRFGDLVQWDTSTHDWLEGRGEPLRLIAMIDDATSQWLGRFVPSDSTAENMGVLELYLKKHGRPGAFYTDKAGLFQTAVKTKRGEQRENLAAILSHVESRRVGNDYTIQFEAKVYQIASKEVRAGLRGGDVRVEKRGDESIAVRFRNRYLAVSRCELRPKQGKPKPAKKRRPSTTARKPSNWNKNFDLQKSVPLWKAAHSSGARPQQLP